MVILSGMKKRKMVRGMLVFFSDLDLLAYIKIGDSYFPLFIFEVIGGIGAIMSTTCPNL
jgi:hypothetical protein